MDTDRLHEVQIEGQPDKCLLVVSPSCRLCEPQFGVSLLKAALAARGVEAEVYYTNLDLMQTHGLWVQQLLRVDFMLDAVSSALVFPRPPRELAPMVDILFRAGLLPDLFRNGRPHETFLRLVRIVAVFRKRVVERVLASGARFVGFSSFYSDRLFCISAIREIKNRAPHLRTIMGGANCYGEMGEELLRLFPEVDYVCQGYAERSLGDLVLALIANGKLQSPIPGVLAREHLSSVPEIGCTPSSVGDPRSFLSRTADQGGAADQALNGSSPDLSAEEFEALPDPDFHDFFAQVEQAADGRGIVWRNGRVGLPGLSPDFRRGVPWMWAFNCFPSVPLETCRGCWWASSGGGRRCAFCGDMQTMDAHLRKRPSVVLAQVRRVAREYQPALIYLTDRLAHPELTRGFWDEIAREEVKFRLSMETVGSIGRDTARLLAKAGTRVALLGIESLDPADLRAMGKPTTVIRNVAALKYFAEAGMWPRWHYLGPTPGSQGSDPEGAAEVIRSIAHLSPPFPPAIRPITVYRFSKYYESPEVYGLGSLSPHPIAERIYPLPEPTVRRLAHEFVSQSPPTTDMTPVSRALANWARVHWRSHLVYAGRQTGGWLIDTRPCRRAIVRRLRNNEAAVYEACREPRSISGLSAALRIEEETVAEILDHFVLDAVMLRQDGLYLSLAVEPSPDYGRLRQMSAADGLARHPMSEILNFVSQFGLHRQAAASTVRSVIKAKAASYLLTLRWRMCCGAVRYAATVSRWLSSR